MMRKILSISVYFFCLVFLFSSVSHAQEPVSVKVDGKVVMRLFSTTEASGAEQATRAMKIISAKLSEASPGKEINIKKEKDGYSIYWGSSFVTAVSKEQAKKQKSDEKSLAELWMKNLIEAVGYENLQVSSTYIRIPLKEEGSVTVGSSGKIETKFDSANIKVEIQDASDKVLITPLNTGEFSLFLKRGRERVIIKILSRERAGTLVPQIEQVVTGNPATPEIILSAVIMRIWDAVILKPGAKFFIKEVPEISKPVSRNSTMKVMVPVVIEGENYFRTEGNVAVNVKNEEILWKTPDELWVSNRPESVKVDGNLFRGRLKKGNSVRLLYSHKNISSENRKVLVSIINKGTAKMKILIRKAAAGPGKFELYTGHMAAMRYMSLYGAEAGYILELAPHSDADIEDSELLPNDLLSGFCDFQILEGREAEINVKTYIAANKPSFLEEINQPFDPFKIHPHGTFPQPVVELSQTHKVSSGTSSEIEVGKWPWKIDAGTGEPNTGNYGVIYKLKMKIINDTPSRHDLVISFVPLNGLSQASVIVDNDLHDIPGTQKDASVNIKRITFAPSEEREIELVTIPEASSCYPVKFVFGAGV